MDDYTNRIQVNPEYIAYDLLDNDPLQDNTIESIYTITEGWLTEANEKQKCSALEPLERQYDRIIVKFDHDFKGRLDKIADILTPQMQFEQQQREINSKKNQFDKKPNSLENLKVSNISSNSNNQLHMAPSFTS